MTKTMNKTPFKIKFVDGNYVLYCSDHDTHETSNSLKGATKLIRAHWQWFHQNIIIFPIEKRKEASFIDALLESSKRIKQRDRILS